MPEQLPEAIAAPRRAPRTWSVLFVLPLLAVALLTYVYATAQRDRGPLITIRFDNAHGLEPGDAVQHRGLNAGQVESIELAPSLEGVIVRARLRRSAIGLAAEGSRFWIVRPTVSLERVQGLETLVGPRYIAVDPAPQNAPRRLVFDGLEDEPDAPLAEADGSLPIVVRARSTASLTVGSPVLYRGVPVGAVRRIELAPDATAVNLGLVIQPRYRPLVRTDSRFWDAGGVSADFGIFGGLSLRAGSLETVLSGGIAFATPNRFDEPAEPGHVFELEPEADSDWLDWDPAIELAGAP
ncbi:MAG: MlaD family protein [Planctomycetota bacterium]